MTDRTILHRARERLAAQKLWGRVSEKAILDGHWDTGDLIRHTIYEIEAEDVRNIKEDLE